MKKVIFSLVGLILIGSGCTPVKQVVETDTTPVVSNIPEVAIATTPEALKNSKLFRDTQKGFEFRYPADMPAPKLAAAADKLYPPVDSAPIWKLEILPKPNVIPVGVGGAPMYDFSYSILAQPLEPYDAVLVKLANETNAFDKAKFAVNGVQGVGYSFGGTCIGREVVLFGPDYLIHVYGCDNRYTTDEDYKNDRFGRETMNLIISTFKFLK